MREQGFHRDLFSTLLGASGGPKWLVLSNIDRLLCSRLLPDRKKPLHMLGSSIGSFRHACFAQRDSLSAIERFEQAYIGQSYEREPTASEVSAQSETILKVMLGASGAREIVGNEMLRNNIVAVRSRSLLASDARAALALGLGAAAVANLLSRTALAWFFDRAVFYAGRASFQFSDFSTTQTALDTQNLRPALLASGSIPMLMDSVRDIPGAPPGAYRDGGIIDYHYDFSFRAPDGLVLYPHFFDRLIPGWLDKSLLWRRPLAARLERVVMLCPSDDFVSRLPRAKVPDRDDFREMGTSERISTWKAVVERCRILAEELDSMLDGGRLADAARPFV